MDYDPQKNLCQTEISRITERYYHFTSKKILFIVALCLLIVISIGIAASTGSADVSFGDVYVSILSKIFPNEAESSWVVDTCLWKLRFPRIFMGLFAGIALGTAGTATQGTLKNPLADPYMLGIASAAGFGAAIAIIFGTGIFAGKYLVVGNAFFFSLIAAAIIIAIAEKKGGSAEAMVLTGIAVMFFFQALTTFVEYFAEAEAVKGAMFWMVGDLGKARWEDFWFVIPITGILVPVLIWKS